MCGLILGSQAVMADISGKVYQDINANGVLDANELGISDVVITVYDHEGNAQGTINSGADGSYTLAPTGSPPYRVEFSTFPTGYFNGPIGVGSNTSVRFVDSANVSDLNFSLHNPQNYVPTDISQVGVLVPAFPTGGSAGQTNTSLSPGILALPYSSSGDSTGAGDINNPDPNRDIPFDQIGSTWGSAYQRASTLLFSSAMLKRHAGLGPLVRPATDSGEAVIAVDGVYRTQFNNSLTGSFVGGFTLNGVTPAEGDAGVIDLGTVTREVISGAVTSAKPNALQNSVNSNSYDIDAFAKVGTIGFGGTEIDASDNFLWLVNLKQKSLIRIDISNPSSLPTSGTIDGSLVGHFSLDLSSLPACNGEYRPWGLTFADTLAYVGVTCDASTGSSNDLHAHVMRFNPATMSDFASVLDIDLSSNSYVRESSQYNISKGTCGLGSNSSWNRWANDWGTLSPVTSGSNNAVFGAEGACPQPLLADMAFDSNGDMIIGFIDRLTLQMDRAKFPADASLSGYFSVDAAGDTLHACKTATGFVLEGQAGCVIDSDDFTTNDDPADRLLDNDGPSKQGEFYYQDHSTVYNSGTAARHVENNLGSVSVLPYSGEVLVTAYDSILGDFNQGFHWYRTQMASGGTAGTRSRQYQIAKDGSGELTTKGMALGEVELLVPPAPLEIGNRIWNDQNSNGVQDAGEAGIDGIEVTLNCGGNDFTQTTANGGQYVFTDQNVTDGIPRNTACTLTVPTTYNSLQLTTQTAGSNVLLDSDPDITNGSISFTTGYAGNNNHSYDIGYAAPPPEPVDLTLAKSVTPLVGSSGDTLTYTLTVNNQSTVSGATSVQVSDELPNGVSYISSTASQGSYDATTGIWDIGAVPASGSATLDIVVTVD